MRWVKGFYKSEDDALFEAIRKFEQRTGVKVELSQYPVQDTIPKTVAALDSARAVFRAQIESPSATFPSELLAPARACHCRRGDNWNIWC